MTKSLLLATAAAASLCMHAGTPAVTLAKDPQPMHVVPARTKVLAAPSANVTLKSVTARDGRQAKSIGINAPTNRINPFSGRKAHRAEAAEGTSLFESFEGWDGQTTEWLPDGWTLDSKGDPELTYIEKWAIDHPSPMLGHPEAPDGECAAMISFSDKPQDEWLISSTVPVTENQVLTFHLFANPLFFFDLSYLDWETYKFTEVHLICNVEVWIQPEGGEWVKAWNLMDKFMDADPYELMINQPSAFEKHTLPLTEYAGKNVKIAFRYVGTDGDTVLLDAVSVSLPALDNVCYSHPAESLYWGFDRQPGWGKLGLTVAQYPSHAPITWFNNTPAQDATFYWTYHHPVTNDWAISDDSDALTVTYTPDYTSEFTTRNNMYYPPVLTANAPGASETSFSASYNYLQAGGKPEFMITDSQSGEQFLWETGLLPFEANLDGITYLVVDDATIGDMAIPPFGHNIHTDLFWLNYTNGSAADGDDVKLTAIMNYLFPAGAPLVVNGVHVLGKGIVSDNVEFKMEIVALNDEGVPDMENPVATAICKGTDMIRQDYSIHQLLTIPFDFDQPVVIDDSHIGYMLKFSGFNSDEVEYFVPLQSSLPHADGIVHGWLVKELKINSDSYRESYSPMSCLDGDFGPCVNAFAMNVTGFYPWLESDVENIDVPSDGTPVQVPLSSYYDGTQLQVEAPAGVEATVAGRYGQCVLTVRHNDADVVAEGTLTVKAPGVHKSFAITENAGINGIEADSAVGTAVEAFTPDGRRISPDEARDGIYIVRYSDGTVKKIRK